MWTWVSIVGGRRSFKVGGQESESVGHAPLGSWRKALSGGLGAPPEADDTFFKNMLFCNGFKDDSDICIHCLQVFNMKWNKNQFGGRKVVGHAIVLAR